MNSAQDPFDRSLASPLAALAALRAAGEDSVVATDKLSTRQRAMYVRTRVDEELAREIQTSGGLRLVLLTGSAGGGKSALIRQLKEGLPPGTLTRVVKDATHADSPDKRQTERLAGVLAGFRSGVPPRGDITVIAANTGLLLELHREFFEHGQEALADVVAYALGVLGVPGKRPLERSRRAELTDAVLVVDLDQRPTSGGEQHLLRRMLRSLDPGDPKGVLEGAQRCRTCTVAGWCAPRTNAELLADDRIGKSLDKAVEQIALRRGRDVAPRQLWDAVSELALGGISLEGDPCDAVARIAHNQDAAAVWRALLPNGALAAPQGDLTRELADLDPSYRASDEVHTVIAAVGISPQQDAQMLERVLSAPEDNRAAVRVAARALKESPEEAARGLVRAHWLCGQIDLDSVIPAAFEEALAGAVDAEDRVIDVACQGLVGAFGRVAEHKAYLPTESLAESREARVLVQIDLDREVELLEDRAQMLNPRGSAVVGWRPLAARLRIGRSIIRLDLPLYRLLEAASRGALAATVDVERFHALRYAAERLGRSAAEHQHRPLLVTYDGQGAAFVVAQTSRRGQQRIKIEKVA